MTPSIWPGSTPPSYRWKPSSAWGIVSARSIRRYAVRSDLIVTNPPYVSDSEWLKLPSEVRDYEPRLALAAGDGLHIFRYLASEAPSWLAPDGVLVAEIGDRQGARIRRAFRDPQWEASVLPDLTGRDRFLIARTTA